RPRDSQVSAWASRQSSVIGTRDELECVAAEVARRYPDEVPLPDFWGGYRVEPETIEFWQGGPARLHDRLRYRRESAAWVVERLAAAPRRGRVSPRRGRGRTGGRAGRRTRASRGRARPGPAAGRRDPG